MSMTRIRTALVIPSACVAAALLLGACSSASGSDTGGGSKTKAEVQKFLNQLSAAVRNNDVDFRLAHLHPTVIERYGEQQCRDFLAGAQDTTRRDRVRKVGKPETYEYATDKASATIPESLPVLTKETNKGKKGDRNIHLARVNGQFTYFTDCGQPLAAQ
ncbi:MAG TPA: hypothetical protein VGR04_01560 [Acidimicrobiia bacterium]|jgi:hypothetical protein|nr:hypothetical protein [Acidimicrobiia bacterium]